MTFHFILLVLALLPRCSARGLLPDPACTPGDVETTDLAVICQTSTADRRRVDASTKRRVLASYGVPWELRDRYEVDHLVPLEGGGANTDANLWAEPLEDAHRKDRVEDAVHREVCSLWRRDPSAASAKLPELQRAFATDWTALEAKP